MQIKTTLLAKKSSVSLHESEESTILWGAITFSLHSPLAMLSLKLSTHTHLERQLMLNLVSYQLKITVALSAFMIATRTHCLPNHVPDASWAIFFLAGLLLKTPIALPILLVLSIGIDYFSIAFLNTPSSCITTAYLFIPLAYACLWLAGRNWHIRHTPTQSPKTIIKNIALGIFLCELITSTSFYMFSGYFQVNANDWMQRLVKFMPYDTMNTAVYILLALYILNTYLAKHGVSNNKNSLITF